MDPAEGDNNKDFGQKDKPNQPRFQLSKHLQKKQDQFLQTKFNPSKPTPNLSGILKTEPGIPEAQTTEKRLRFVPQFVGNSEREHAQARAQAGQTEEISEKNPDQDTSEKPQVGNALLNKDIDESKNRMAQMLDQNRPRLGKKPTSDNNSKVIFGDPRTSTGLKLQGDASDSDDERGDELKTFTAEANEKLKGHLLPIELPFHHTNEDQENLSSEFQRRDDVEKNKFHNIECPLKYCPNIISEDKWNILQLPSDHLCPKIEGILPSEAELEGLEGINYEDRSALLRHFTGLTYDSCGFIINKNFGNSENSASVTPRKNPSEALKNENLNVGKLKVYKSGKIKMEIGNKKYLIAEGTHVNFKQSLVGLSHASKRGYYINDVDNKYISISI